MITEKSHLQKYIGTEFSNILSILCVHVMHFM